MTVTRSTQTAGSGRASAGLNAGAPRAVNEQFSRRALWLSLLVPVAVAAVIILVVRPWGNYPLTDDWIYARIARRFTETGKFIFDHDTGAAFVGQGVLASLVIRFAGFSHTHLRELTMAVSCVLMFLLWQLLHYARVRPTVRAMALLTVACNPIYAAVSMSFLTDIYGYAVALLGAVIWFRSRTRLQSAEEPVVSWPAALLTGLVVGAGFWIRQHGVLVLPALLGSTALGAWRAGELRRFWRSLPRMAVTCVVFAATVAAYFWFAKYKAVVPMTDFNHRLHRIFPIYPVVPILCVGIFVTYMTAFFFPALLCLPARVFRYKPVIVLAVVLLVVGGFTALMVLQAPPDRDIFHVFPFLDDYLSNAGVGPILLPDLLVQPQHPRWPTAVWVVIECVLLAVNILWAAVIVLSRRTLRKRPGSAQAEIIRFAAIFTFSMLALNTLIDRLATFDRYYLPELFGLTLITAIVLSRCTPPAGWPAMKFRFAVALLPLIFFTTAGLHDFFRIQDVRWDLFNEATARGASPANLQAGREINGWAAYDFILSKTPPPACIGPCGCSIGWYCLDDSYRIGMNVYGNYEVLVSQTPSYWLAPGPPLYLSRRRRP